MHHLSLKPDPYEFWGQNINCYGHRTGLFTKLFMGNNFNLKEEIVFKVHIYMYAWSRSQVRVVQNVFPEAISSLKQ